jgi:hypothetical protein
LAPLVASDYLIKMLARPAMSRLVYRRQISGSGSQGPCCRAFAGPNLKAAVIGEAVSLWASAVKNVSKFEIELLSKNGASVIGVANDAESALSVMDEAMRQYRQATFESDAGPRSLLSECRHGHHDDAHCMPYFLLTFGDASRPPVGAVIIEAPSMFQAA